MEVKLELDYYQTLGIAVNANEKEIRKAYKALCQKHHPDKTGKEGTAFFLKIRKAYDVLVDPQRRVVYDQGLKQGINPEEFKKILQSMAQSVAMGAMDTLANQPGCPLTSAIKLRLETEKDKLHLAMIELRTNLRIITKQTDKITEGLDAHVVKAILAKAQELNAGIRTCEVALAVTKYLQEDSNRIMCPEPIPQRLVSGPLITSWT